MNQTKEMIAFAGMEVHDYLDASDTNDQLGMFKCIVASGAKMGVPHFHEHFDETVYGLKGKLTYMVNGKQIEIGTGDPLFIPRGATHAFANNGTETAEILCVVNPAIFGPEFFREVAAVFNVGGPPDVPKILGIMREHGLVPVIG